MPFNWQPNEDSPTPQPIPLPPNQDITVKGRGNIGAGSSQYTQDGPTLSGVRRDPGDVPEERKQLLLRKVSDIKLARKFWKEDFERMKSDQDMLAGLQWEGQTTLKDDRYVVNVVQRHISQRTAAIYAKNPTVVCRRKDMMDYKLWDESPVSFQMATQTVSMAAQQAQAAQGGDPMASSMLGEAAQNPQAMKVFALAQALLADIQQGTQRKMMKQRVCKTMELYFKNKVLHQQNPPFKASMKQLVRRTLANGVGYLKLSLLRDMQPGSMTPDELKGMATIQERMAQIELLMADLADDEGLMQSCSAEKEELRLMLESMRNKPMEVTQEGIVFDFPSGTSIIPDWRMVHLQGFVGCNWVAEEYLLTPNDIQKVWKVDVEGQCAIYDPDNPAVTTTPNAWSYTADYPAWGLDGRGYGIGSDGRLKKGLACVWVLYDRADGLVYTMCDGYPDFLEEPDAPPLLLERFFPWYPLAFNYIEHHKYRFPLSDCFLMKQEQREMNRCREGLRQHRIAARPLTAVANGMLDDRDKEKLQTRPANAVVQLNALQPGQKIEDVLQVVHHPGIDPNLYDVSPQFEDILRTVGTQEANLGGTSDATATESSIAESSRMSSLQSNMDDMDDFLTEVMRDAGKVALMEIGSDEVTRVVGVGAAWPTLSTQDIADEIFLEIVAGSSGRPNKALEVQNFTQAAPFLMQLPGINPYWLAREMLTRLDDRLDLTDAFVSGQPSIQAMNAMAAKPLTSQPTDPNAQMPENSGPQGALNAPAPQQPNGQVGPANQNAMPPNVQPIRR
jgi:hypothetical protein